MSLADDLQALINESTHAAARTAEGMRATDHDRGALFSEFVVLNSNVQGIENAIRALSGKVEELDSIILKKKS